MAITIVLLAAFAGILIGLPFFLKWLAKGDILYTEVPEGTAKAIMRSESLDHFVMSLKGYHLNKPGTRWFNSSKPEWEVLKDRPGKKYDDRNPLTRWLGLYWVGIPPFRQVYSYTFGWNEQKLDKSTGNMDVWTREERTNFIYIVAFPYVVVLVEAETDDNLPVTLQILVTIRVVNPAKALFETEDWMKVISGTVISAARNFVGSKKYAELVSESKIETQGGTAEGDRLCTSVCALNEKLPDGSSGLHERYGVVVDKADIQRVDIAGEKKAEILEATVQQYTADQKAYTVKKLGKAEAEAVLAKGTAEAGVIAKKGEAEASAIEKKGLAEATALTARLNAWNDGGALNGLIAQTEAMSSAGPNKTVIWANNPFVRKVDGLAETLDSLGIRTLDDLKKALGVTTEKAEEKSA